MSTDTKIVEISTSSSNGRTAILLLDCPTGLNVGLDYCMWQIKNKFMGIREITPGAHFLYWNPPDENDVGVLGRFLYFSTNKTFIFRWSTTTDTFELIDNEEAERYAAGIVRGDFDANLGQYPTEWLQQWNELSFFITNDIIDKIEPVTKFIYPMTKEYDEDDKKKVTRFSNNLVSSQCCETTKDLSHLPKTTMMAISSNAADSEILPTECSESSSTNGSLKSCLKKGLIPSKKNYTRLEGNDEKTHIQTDTLFFCEIPSVEIPLLCNSAEMTRLSLDKSSVLRKLISSQFSGNSNQLLGELQFAYICFLLGQNYLAFEQWKSLVILLSHCEDAVIDMPDLFSDFLRILHCHLTQAPDDFFSDVLMAGNFLVQCLGNLCEVCSDVTLPLKLRRRVTYIKDLIIQKFRMPIEDLLALEENAPIIINPEESFVSFNNNEIQETNITLLPTMTVDQ